MLSVSIPVYKFRGDHAILECNYELNNNNFNYNSNSNSNNNKRHDEYDSEEQKDDGREHLYSVKWYKDNEEFYRFVPKANPPKHSYKVEGIRVDVSSSIF